ncbi:hypothetical protein [Pedobacter xixiisoli]|uniref:Uncharacterized protein n=1 Tax=Pedobacter xixiisoli TaxID=1476464 RepID=A0A285ZUP1_9SPHI|nr:hypothetical protein [Pedobacter xixiisoli]SOD13377.1 hypothetical protein SAMN06297358_1204 [Pedobacter xixiisoli]
MQTVAIDYEKKELITLLVNFLKEIGLTVEFAVEKEPGFLPGIHIRNGGLSIDTEKLLHPGDILHEAGHLATLPYHIRCELDGKLPDTDTHRSAELMTLAWSYAATLHLKIPANVVFHENGYKGGAQNLIDNFEQGRFIGVPMLQYYGLTYDEQNAERLGVQPFPHMVNWVCLK